MGLVNPIYTYIYITSSIIHLVPPPLHFSRHTMLTHLTNVPCGTLMINPSTISSKKECFFYSYPILFSHPELHPGYPHFEFRGGGCVGRITHPTSHKHFSEGSSKFFLLAVNLYIVCMGWINARENLPPVGITVRWKWIDHTSHLNVGVYAPMNYLRSITE